MVADENGSNAETFQFSHAVYRELKAVLFQRFPDRFTAVTGPMAEERPSSENATEAAHA